ncbi:hypothetical protein B0T16DRAFT_69101 [Cercophora newfieldiana]|uniref:Uncharacterized protein n=1 Tax=Cercophora newfieldiana TaxID=92897 RepID=A0AA40CZY2_9PEZI|nr:hypothetical protein B0T16DRAFT_69101 [Cercophora newfieldiana]
MTNSALLPTTMDNSVSRYAEGRCINHFIKSRRTPRRNALTSSRTKPTNLTNTNPKTNYMTFNRATASILRRQARNKLSQEASLRDPDLRRLVGHANLIDDLCIRTSLEVRGWNEDEDEGGADVEDNDEDAILNDEGDSPRLYKDEDGEDDPDDDTESSESEEDSDDSSSDDSDEWWDEPLSPTDIQPESGDGCERGAAVKTAEEIIDITEVIEGSTGYGDTNFEERASLSHIAAAAESKWKAGDAAADLAEATVSLTLGETYRAYGRAHSLDPDGFVGPYLTAMGIEVCCIEDIEVLGLS